MMKKKMYMRFLAIILSFVMVISILPADVFAAENSTEEQIDVAQEQEEQSIGILSQEEMLQGETTEMEDSVNTVEKSEENLVDSSENIENMAEDEAFTDAVDDTINIEPEIISEESENGEEMFTDEVEVENIVEDSTDAIVATDEEELRDTSEKTYVQLGKYPQEEVKDSNLISILNNMIVDENSEVVYKNNRYRLKNKKWYIFMPIKWRILSQDGDRALVMSEYILDTCALNTSWDAISWKNSYAREWLNSTFYNVAFSEEEQSVIYTSTLENTMGGTTEDKIYYPLVKDLQNENYGFVSAQDRTANETEFCDSNETYLTRNTSGNVMFGTCNGVYAWSGNITTTFPDSWWGARPFMSIDLTKAKELEEKEDYTGRKSDYNTTERSVMINYSGTPSGRFYLCTPDGAPISDINFTYTISGEYSGEQMEYVYTRKTDENGAYDFGWPHPITYSSGSNNKYIYEIKILSVNDQTPDLLNSKFTLNAEVKNLEYTETWAFGLSNTIQTDITKYSALKKGLGGVGTIALKHNSDLTKDLTLSVQLSDSVFGSLSGKLKKANFKDQTASVGVKIGEVSNTKSSTNYKTFSKKIKGFDPLKKEHRELLAGYLFIIFNLSMENNIFLKQALDKAGYNDIFLKEFDVSESGIEVKVASDASAVNLKLTSTVENPLIDVSLFQPIKLCSMSSDSTYTYSVTSEEGDYKYKTGVKAESGFSGYSTLFDNMLGISGRMGWARLNDMSVSAKTDEISFKSCNFDSGVQEEISDLTYKYRNYVATGDAMAEISKNKSVDRLRKGVLGPVSQSELIDIAKSIENTTHLVSYTDTDKEISRISWSPSISIKNPLNEKATLLSLGAKFSASRNCETEIGNGYYLEGEVVESSNSNTVSTIANDKNHLTNCNDIFSYALLGMAEAIGDTLSQATNSVVNGVKNGAAKIGATVGSAVDWTISITSSRKKDKITSENEIQSYDVVTSAKENVQSESEQILAKTVGDSYLVSITDKNGNEVTDLSAQPLSLTLSYTEEELKAAEVDETMAHKLAIYRYYEENDIMNYVGGTVDSEKKTVTAMIDKTGEYILVVDGAAPQVTEFGVSDTSSLPVLSAIIRDESGISNLTVILDGETIVDSTNLEKYYNTKTGEFIYEVAKELFVGTHTISFCVTDSTGNTNENISYQFEVTQAPQIDSVSVPDGIEMTKENQIAISASAKAFVNGEKENKISDVVAKIEIVNMDGTKKDDRISLELAQDIWSAKIIVAKQTIQYNIQLIAYDELGGKVYSEVYPCKITCSHKWDEPIKKEATCIETGSIKTVCQVCGETKLEEIPALGHKEVKDDAIEATCTETGKSEGSHCSVCNTIIKEQVVIPAKGHSLKEIEKITKATLEKDGLISGKCGVCGKENITEVIPHPQNIELSTTSYTYTGKAKKPAVKVIDSNGQIIDSSNYDIIYPSGRINVGTYELTVKFKGDKYTGSTTKTFTINLGNQTLTGTKEYKKVVGNARFYLDVKRTKGNGALSYKSSNTSVASVSSAGRVTINGIGMAKITVTAAATKSYKKKTFTVTITVNPRSTTLSSVTSGTSANMTVKWAKNSAVTGYEISYATKSDFSNERTYLVTSYKTTSKTIGKRTEGKKYYVRIRCYKTVNGVKYYSSWSAAKTVIILPKTVTISSVTSTTAGKLSVNWSQNANVTGYQIQYATKSSFSGARTSSITNYKTTSKVISGLTKGKKYYVRIRCYKTVSGVKYYSAWSSAKTVTVKK